MTVLLEWVTVVGITSGCLEELLTQNWDNEYCTGRVFRTRLRRSGRKLRCVPSLWWSLKGKDVRPVEYRDR